MPELPEVEIVRRRLAVCLPGLVLRGVVVNDALVSEKSEAELRALLEGRRVVGLRRRGKYLIVDFGPREGAGGEAAGAAAATPYLGSPWTGPSVAVIHLRMTGQLLFQPGPADRPPRFAWRLEPGAELSFQDVRRFGRLWAFRPHEEEEFFAWMGPEPFGDAFTVAYLRRALQGRTAPLKSFLLDQRRIAGVGNIYADEALFRARLHPLRAAGSVGPREAQRLHAALLETLAGRHRPRRLVHRELRRSGRRARQLPGDPQRVPAHRRALSRLRHADPSHRGRRSRHALLPALPTAARRHRAYGPPPPEQRRTGAR